MDDFRELDRCLQTSEKAVTEGSGANWGVGRKGANGAAKRGGRVWVGPNAWKESRGWAQRRRTLFFQAKGYSMP